MTNLLGVVEKTALKAGSTKVDVIHLRIGEMSGVNIEALTFAFEVLSKGTVAESAQLKCETVPLAIRCRVCGSESHPDEFVFRCSSCGSSETDIISGREMEIDYILVNDDERSTKRDSACCGGNT